MSAVDLSRLQFALTALYHFLFVPLTLGLVMILAMMESVYVVTGKEIWKQMTKFWGILFAINFAMGVATGITMEFQFGMNWAYYAHYVGDIFGVPLAIEGMTAFFLEATFVGIFFFGWDRLSPKKHLLVTWLLAFATSISAFWILVANGWMQHPVGSSFNMDTMRMELTSLYEILLNPVAQAKFVHTVNSGYVMGCVFVMAISSYYLLNKRHIEFAQKSMRVAALFGLLSTILTIILGDESGYVAAHSQKMKLAAIEAMWETEPAPAGLTVIGLPDLYAKDNKYAIHIPYVLGIIATRSLNTQVPGIKDLIKESEGRIRKGIIAYKALEEYRANPGPGKALDTFKVYQEHLGYGLLLKRHVSDPSQATEADVLKAAEDTMPNVPLVFFCFRLMAGCGLFFLAFFVLSVFFSLQGTIAKREWLLKASLFSLPLPWIATSSGWIIAECGRQPWAIEGVLPTFYGASSLAPSSVWISLIGFIVLYSFLAVVDFFLMLKYARLGPDAALSPRH